MDQTRGSNERYGVLETSVQRTVAAAGSAQTDATLIGANVTIVTAASGTNGVILRKPKSANNFYTGAVYSSAATNALLVYPPTGGTINNGTINAALSLPARKVGTFMSVNGTDFVINISA